MINFHNNLFTTLLVFKSPAKGPFIKFDVASKRKWAMVWFFDIFDMFDNSGKVLKLPELSKFFAGIAENFWILANTPILGNADSN